MEKTIDEIMEEANNDSKSRFYVLNINFFKLCILGFISCANCIKALFDRTYGITVKLLENAFALVIYLKQY